MTAKKKVTAEECVVPNDLGEGYSSKLIKNTSKLGMAQRILVGTPTRGTVRMEWVLARFGQLIPCNWSTGNFTYPIETYAPMGFMVPDAQNVIIREAVLGGYEWVLLLEDDTIPPHDMFMILNEYMRSGDVPIVSGLYYTKSDPPEPLVYRGRGNSYYDDFVLGEKVWADGVPTGCLLINMKIINLMWQESPEYPVGSVVTRRVFEIPEKTWVDPETGRINAMTGTSDLAWCQRVIDEDVIGRAGWPKIAKKEFPFLVDTRMFCRHISPDGTMYPPAHITPNARRPE